MTGFRGSPAANRVRKVVFAAGSEFDGLVIRTRGITVNEYLNESITAEFFLDRVEEWNWETDDGDPIKLTMEGIAALDQSDLRTVMMQWVREVTAVRPLALVGSRPTRQSGEIEETLTMESPG